MSATLKFKLVLIYVSLSLFSPLCRVSLRLAPPLHIGKHTLKQVFSLHHALCESLESSVAIRVNAYELYMRAPKAIALVVELT